MNARGKQIDTTFLSLENAEERGFLHRDYIAHCFRWTHVVKRLMANKRYLSDRILDIGCGRELPLPKTLYSMRVIPEAYYGVDYGPIPDESMAMFHTGKFPLVVYEKTDVCDLTLFDLGGEKMSVVTCFEMLEHVEPRHVLRVLQKVREVITDDSTVLISTPNWDGINAAANHVNEMRHEALGAVLESSGFVIKARYGTFASIRDYEHLLTDEQRDLFVALRGYYDTNVLSVIFAPLFPSTARNCLWVLQPGEPKYRYFPSLTDVQRPWTSSLRWEELQCK